jgi:TolA-binding protein
MVGTQGTDIAVLKTEMLGARADITSIKATQSDHGELLKEHSKRFDKVEISIAELKATQSDHGELLKEHSKRFDKVEISIAELKVTQDSQGQKLDQILQLLQRKGE